MAFWDSFFGNKQREDITNADAKSTKYLGQGRDDAVSNLKAAQDIIKPYAAQGTRANALYGDATGANGQDAYQAAMGNFAGSDPFRQQNEAYARQADQNRYSARGWSGNASLAAARASTERGATDWNNYLMRLQGQGQQGFQATGAVAGLQQGIGDVQNGYNQQMAGNAINYGNAMASSRTQGVQNILGAAGTLAGAAFGLGGGMGGSAGGMSSPGTLANGGWSTRTIPSQGGSSLNRLFSGFGG